MNCKNCQTTIEESQNYCWNCGAKIITSKITIRGIFDQVNEEYINVDNKLFRTFKDLLVKPEDVIDGYLNGLRKRYSNIISFLALSLTLLGFQFFILKRFLNEDLNNVTYKSGNPKIDEIALKFNDLLTDYIGILTIVFIPAVALITYFVFSQNRKHNYAEHIVINTFITAEYNVIIVLIFFALLPFGINSTVSFLVISIITYLYMGYVFKRLYSLTFIEVFSRILITIILYSIGTGLLILFLGIITGIFLVLTNKEAFI